MKINTLGLCLWLAIACLFAISNVFAQEKPDPVKDAYVKAEKALAAEIDQMTDRQLAGWDLADLSVRLDRFFKECAVPAEHASVLSGKLLAAAAEFKADAAAYLAEQRMAKSPPVTVTASTPAALPQTTAPTNTYGLPTTTRSKPSPITRSGTISAPSGSSTYSIDRRGGITVYGRDGATFVD